MSAGPITPTINAEMIPIEMRSLDHWVCWRAERTKRGKLTKVPYRADGHGKASTTDSKTWSSFAAALVAVDKYHGIGFVTTKECGIILLDLDHCIVDGDVALWAREIVRIARSYVEASPSGNGLHCYFKGTLSSPCINRKDDKGSGAEIYDTAHYFTVTGVVQPEYNAPFRHLTEAETETIYRLVEARKPEKVRAQTITCAPLPVLVLKSDPETLDLMYRSRSGAAIQSLMGGDTSAYGGDQSRADAALCAHLAFWFRKDPAAIDRIFRQSNLMRDKWNEAHYADGSTYGEMTIRRAIEMCKETYSDGQRQPQIAAKAQTCQGEIEVADSYDLRQWSAARFASPPTPRKMRIENLLPENIVSVMFSLGGSGKSTIALDACVRMAIAEKFPTGFLNIEDMQVHPGRVIMWSFEDPDDESHRRVYGIVNAIAERLMVPPAELWQLVDKNLFIINQRGDLAPWFEIDEWKKTISQTPEYEKAFLTICREKPALAVVDTRSRISAAEGMGNAIVTREVAKYEKPVAEAGSGLTLLHHTRKSSYGLAEAGQGDLRGESAFLDSIRCGMAFQPLCEKDAENYGISADDRKHFFVFSNPKNNYILRHDPVIIRRSEYSFTPTDYKPRPKRGQKKSIQLDSDTAVVLGIIKKNPGIQRQNIIALASADKVAYHRCLDVLDKAKAAKQVTVTIGAKGKQTYE